MDDWDGAEMKVALQNKPIWRTSSSAVSPGTAQQITGIKFLPDNLHFLSSMQVLKSLVLLKFEKVETVDNTGLQQGVQVHKVQTN